VHDAGREEEQELQSKYLKGFTLIKKTGWHQSRCAYWEKHD
jgi:hypothetical protein